MIKKNSPTPEAATTTQVLFPFNLKKMKFQPSRRFPVFFHKFKKQ